MDQTKTESSGEFSGPYLEPVPDSMESEAQRAGAPNLGHLRRRFWGHGVQVVTIKDSNIKSSSSVVASIHEVLNVFGSPLGSAHMAVLNVFPFNGGVFVRVKVDFDRPLIFVVAAIYAN